MQDRDVAVITFDGGNGGPVGACDGVECLSGLYFVSYDDGLSLLSFQSCNMCRLRRRRFYAGGYGLRAFCLARCNCLGVARAGRYRKMQGEDAAAVEAVASDAVPAAEHLRRNSKIVCYRFDRIPRMNLVARNAAGIGRTVGRRMFARGD